jgi:hypothetical protein
MFYVQTLVDEMGFDDVTLDSIGKDSYKPCSEGESFHVDKISDILKERFNVKVDDKNLRLARKQLNVQVNSCLKLLRKYFKKFCEAIYNNSGINMFWSIDSSHEFLETIVNSDIYNIQVY